MYVGIDVHKRKCVATIKSGSSKKVLARKDFANNTQETQGFIRWLRHRYGKQSIKAVCESTANYWIRMYDALEDGGIDVTLAHPAKTKVIAHARLKDDRVDSEILADLLKADMIAESYVPDKKHRDLRTIIRTRTHFVRNATREKNCIHAILAKHDLPRPKNLFNAEGLAWLSSIDVGEADHMTLMAHADALKTAILLRDTAEKNIAAKASLDDRCKLIMTIPGISFVGAMSIVSEIGDISRFKTAEKLVSYSGMVPSRRNSGDTIQQGGHITKQGSTWLRSTMVEAALAASRFDTRMKDIYERISIRRGKQKARVAVARHMLEIIWHMLTYKTEYRTQNPELTKTKYNKMRSIANSDKV